MRQRLILVVPPETAPAALAEAIGGGDVAAVILPSDLAATGTLVEAAQRGGVAALLRYRVEDDDGTPWPLAYQADGVHADGAFAARQATVETRPEGAMIGAAAATRHEAMDLGEAGADYIWFGSVAALDEETLDLAIWWQVLFEVPAVLAGPHDPAAIGQMIATRVEFIAVNVFDAARPGDAVARINDLIDQAVPSS